MTDDPFKVAKVRTAERLAADEARRKAYREEARSKLSKLESIAMRLVEKYGTELDREGYALCMDNNRDLSFSLYLFYKQSVYYDTSSDDGPYIPPSVSRGSKKLLEILYSRYSEDVFIVECELVKFHDPQPWPSRFSTGNFENIVPEILGAFVSLNIENLSKNANAVSSYYDSKLKKEMIIRKESFTRLLKLAAIISAIVILYRVLN